MDTSAGSRIRIESRWPPVLAILALLGVLAVLPARVRLLPPWAAYVIGAGLALPMMAVGMTAGHWLWRRIERASTLVFAATAEAVTLATLSYLIVEMMSRPADFSGLQLFTSSVGAWVTNVLVFSLAYWHIDQIGRAHV